MEKFEPFIDKCYQDLADRMNAFDQKMKMKLECIADKAIWTAKKRYILNVWNQEGVVYDKAKLKMTGIEAVKSSTPMACRNKIKACLDLVMNKDEDTMQKFIMDFREEFKTLSFEEIAGPRGVSNLTDYICKQGGMYIKGTPIHAKGSIFYNSLINKYKLNGQYDLIGNGDKIKFCYLKSPNPYAINVISAPGELPTQFGIEKFIDYEVQFNKTFIDPLSIILTAIGWSAEKRSTLDSFFG
jgi:DNA polymerase elongation subunit (family B)